jgi:hypothetical protein
VEAFFSELVESAQELKVEDKRAIASRSLFGINLARAGGLRTQLKIELVANESRYGRKLSKKQLIQRWNTTRGQDILTRWKTNDFDCQVLNNLVGKSTVTPTFEVLT